jgi:hypothetical protein
MNCFNQFKALKERSNIAPGEAQRNPGYRGSQNITAEQRDSFEITNSNEAVQFMTGLVRQTG